MWKVTEDGVVFVIATMARAKGVAAQSVTSQATKGRTSVLGHDN
jgi:hypothetical protein